jgi:hypothetical protein
MINYSEQAVSFKDFINSPASLREKTKHVLAVLLGYAVLHLCGTPWT